MTEERDYFENFEKYEWWKSPLCPKLKSQSETKF